MLLIANQRGEGWIEPTSNLRRIYQPLVFVRLQPSETVADDHSPPGCIGHISARPVQRRSQEHYCRARSAFDGDWRLSRFG